MELLTSEFVLTYKSLEFMAKKEVRAQFRDFVNSKSNSRFERLMKRKDPALPREKDFLEAEVKKHLVDQQLEAA